MIKSTSQQGTYQKCYRQIRIIILILYWQIRKHISALLTHFLLYKKGRNVNWLGHTRRNYFLEHVIEGNVEGRIELTGRRRRRLKQLVADLREMRGYCKSKQEAINCTLWRTRFRRGYGPVAKIDYRIYKCPARSEK